MGGGGKTSTHVQAISGLKVKGDLNEGQIEPGGGGNDDNDGISTL